MGVFIVNKTTKNGIHMIHGIQVDWNNGRVLSMSREGVPLRLMYYDRRHGGDGYSPVDLTDINFPNLYRKIRLAVAEDNIMYQLREVA